MKKTLFINQKKIIKYLPCAFFIIIINCFTETQLKGLQFNMTKLILLVAFALAGQLVKGNGGFFVSSIETSCKNHCERSASGFTEL